jgi:hypothetical protein
MIATDKITTNIEHSYCRHDSGDTLTVTDAVTVELTAPTRQERLFKRFEAYFGRKPDVNDRKIAGEVVGLLDLLAAS